MEFKKIIAFHFISIIVWLSFIINYVFLKIKVEQLENELKEYERR